MTIFIIADLSDASKENGLEVFIDKIRSILSTEYDRN